MRLYSSNHHQKCNDNNSDADDNSFASEDLEAWDSDPFESWEDVDWSENDIKSHKDRDSSPESVPILASCLRIWDWVEVVGFSKTGNLTFWLIWIRRSARCRNVVFSSRMNNLGRFLAVRRRCICNSRIVDWSGTRSRIPVWLRIIPVTSRWSGLFNCRFFCCWTTCKMDCFWCGAVGQLVRRWSD